MILEATVEMNNLSGKLANFGNITLPNNLKNGLTKLAKFIQKSAKLRAPRWRGELAKGIIVTGFIKKKDSIELGVKSTVHYAAVQEYGYAALGLPPFRVGFPLYGRIREWAKDKAPHFLKRKKGGITLDGYTPHLRPAWEDGIARIDDIMNRSAEKAIKDANL